MFLRILPIILILLAGCAKPNPAPVSDALCETGQITEPAEAEGEAVIRRARSALGSRYVSGGTGQKGFDCSGLVQWAMDKNLPRSAKEQSMLGSAVKSRDALLPGDIVVFRPKQGWHVGIYIGDGDFIHSSSKYAIVKVANLDKPYFKSIFREGRRLD